jgi:2''-5'' RNA ligase
MLRLFVAIPMPDEVCDQLQRLCVGLQGARWVERDAMHLTLRFIGEVDGAAAEDIHEALLRISAPAFDLVGGGVGCFEQSGKVHTLWAGVEKQPLLGHLRDKIESALVRAGVEPDHRKFKAHITLARSRSGIGARLGDYLQRHGRFVTPPFTVDHFTLFRSHLSSDRAYYEILAEYALKRGAAPQSPLRGGAPASAPGS